MEYEFEHAEPVTVALRATNGSVRIDAGRTGTVRVEVTALDGSAAAREAAENTRVLLEGDTLVVAAPQVERWRWRRGPALRLTIEVPEGSTLTGESAAADVHATGRYRDVHLKAASADIGVTDVLGDVHLTAASGNLSLERAGGAAALKSASGKLRIGDVTGDVIASTSSGDISLGSGGGSLEAGTASGDIVVGSLSRGRARIRTASGDVTVGVAPGTGVWLDVTTASGDSSIDLAAQDGISPVADGPGLEVRVRTASGDVRIHRATDRVIA
ncbi:DUF4097 family beta strand repeat-containing protein [Actinoplanes teichomyceticus]|uniref:Putative adhesin n=1 Tax=Actinoplanes teichomyceticus TaxID=1867 RepID=A0A561W9N0_ACTTI|nr:DUF4097 family beta strand repeat-containing protein [Actinoplanes teichomyceticus]TWG20564.1 putative adhesin [Actinoplanes teichomyceticus]GIF15899.1 hypothetical protein Ate01nite_59310 [Actinoplanes teichomyceticus]